MTAAATSTTRPNPLKLLQLARSSIQAGTDNVWNEQLNIFDETSEPGEHLSWSHISIPLTHPVL